MPTLKQLYKEYDEQCLNRYVCRDLRVYKSSLMSNSPFSLCQIDPTGWRFSWYAPSETHKWSVEDLFVDGEYIYIGPKDPGVKLITIRKSRKGLNIDWEKKTISYKGKVDEFITWEND